MTLSREKAVKQLSIDRGTSDRACCFTVAAPMATHILAASDDNQGLVALLANTYAGMPAGEVHQAAAQLQLQSLGSSQVVLSELVPICQQLARLSSKTDQLLGPDQLQEAQVGADRTCSAAVVVGTAEVTAEGAAVMQGRVS